jgi:hypothetical protein
MLSAAAIVALCAPVAIHRGTFRRHRKARVLVVSTLMATLGLGLIAAALSGSVALVVSAVDDSTAVTVVLTALTVAAFAVAWFALPLTLRLGPGDGDVDADYPPNAADSKLGARPGSGAGARLTDDSSS